MSLGNFFFFLRKSADNGVKDLSGVFPLPFLLWSEINRVVLWRTGFWGFWWVAGGFLNHHVIIHQSPRHILPTPRWKFWNLFGWFMYAKYDRYILGLYLGSKDGPACFRHEPTQIAIKTFRVAKGDGVCRPPQRSPKHGESFTNEQLWSLHKVTVWGEAKKHIFSKFSWWVGCYFCDSCKPLRAWFSPIFVIHVSRKESRKISEITFIILWES